MSGSVVQRPPADVTVLRARLPPRGEPRTGEEPRVLLVVALLQAAAMGASSLFAGYYDFRTWGLLSAVSLGALVAVLVARPPRLSTPARVAIAGLLLLLAWSALSIAWADSPDRAWTEVNRLALYASTFVIALCSMRGPRDVRLVAVVLGGAIALASLVTLAQLLLGDQGAFLSRRLNAPVDYINGTSGLLLMGIWPLVAAAESDRLRWRASAALGLAAAEAGLLVLTQSRAAIPALLLSATVVLVAFPGRLRRFWAVATIVAAVAATLPWTLSVFSAHAATDPAPAGPGTIRAAGLAVVVAGITAAAVWRLAQVAISRGRPRIWRTLSTTAAVCVLAALPLAVLAVDHDPAATVRNSWHRFTALHVDARATTRFTDVGGYRYDLWRVAWSQFRNHPFSGVGAGGYGLRYYQLRRNPQDVRQPHSLEMQMLAELGLAGGAGLLLFVAGGAWALFRRRHGAVPLRVALGGLCVVWLVHTSVDWLYNLPGLTGMALIAAAGIIRLDRDPQRPDPHPRSRLVRLTTAATICIAALGAASLGREYIAQLQRDDARHSLRSNPVAALSDTRRALGLNPDDVDTYFVRAAAFARLGNYAGARGTLVLAARREPLNYVPWALLGDVAVRQGRWQDARAAYAHAASLNPGDVALRRLAQHSDGRVP